MSRLSVVDGEEVQSVQVVTHESQLFFRPSLSSLIRQRPVALAGHAADRITSVLLPLLASCLCVCVVAMESCTLPYPTLPYPLADTSECLIQCPPLLRSGFGASTSSLIRREGTTVESFGVTGWCQTLIDAIASRSQRFTFCSPQTARLTCTAFRVTKCGATMQGTR